MSVHGVLLYSPTPTCNMKQVWSCNINTLTLSPGQKKYLHQSVRLCGQKLTILVATPKSIVGWSLSKLNPLLFNLIEMTI